VEAEEKQQRTEKSLVADGKNDVLVIHDVQAKRKVIQNYHD